MGKRKASRSPASAHLQIGLADEVCHAAARAGLNAELVSDPAVEDLFHRWAKETGVAVALLKIAALPAAEFAAAVQAGAIEQALTPHRDRFKHESNVFVRAHMERLIWDWVAVDVAEAFTCELLGSAFGIDVTREFAVRDAEPEQLVSLDATVEDLLILLAGLRPGARASKRRMPKNGGAELEEGARWLYRVWVCGEKPEAIGKEYTRARRETVAIGDRNTSTVLERIKRAEWALGLPVVVVRNS